jgi:acid phosphatase
MSPPGRKRIVAALALAAVVVGAGVIVLTRPAIGPPPWQRALPDTLAARLARALPHGPRERQVPRLEHVLVCVMENKSYYEASRQPFTASLMATGASFPDAYAVTHPSQPNYLALWSGSTMGVTSNRCPPPGAPFTGENLGHALAARGLRWAAYCEDLPAPGSPVVKHAHYVRRHAPWTDFANLDSTRACPLEQLARDVAGDSLPTLAFVIPNLLHDTHNAGYGARYGDDWLAEHVPGWLRALGPRGLFVLTWDEDDYSSANRILTVFAGPLVRPGATSAREVSHFTVLRTITDGLGLPPFGAAAVDSPVVDVWR